MAEDYHQHSGNNNKYIRGWGFSKQTLWVFKHILQTCIVLRLFPKVHVSKVIHNYSSERKFMIVNISLS